MSQARRIGLAIAAGATAVVLSQVVDAQRSGYSAVENHFMMPDGRKVGSTAGITIDTDGTSVWVFERCGANDCVGSNVARSFVTTSTVVISSPV